MATGTVLGRASGRHLSSASKICFMAPVSQGSTSERSATCGDAASSMDSKLRFLDSLFKGAVELDDMSPPSKQTAAQALHAVDV